LLQRRATVFFVVCQNHRPHVRDSIFDEAHVFSAAQSNSFRTERARLNRVAKNISISVSSTFDGIELSLPLMTRPVVPSSEIQSPSLNVFPFTCISRFFSST